MISDTIFGIFIIVVSWGLYMVLSALRNIQFPTTIIVNIETEEKDEFDFPMGTYQLEKEVPMRISPTIGMQIEHSGFCTNLEVKNIVAHEGGAAIVCAPIKFPEETINEEVERLERHGWSKLPSVIG